MENQKETKKEVKKGKELLIDLKNMIKIITSNDKTLSFKRELIIKYSQGELLDLDVTPI